MKFAMNTTLVLTVSVTVLLIGSAVCLMLMASCSPKLLLKPGPIAGKTVYLENARNYPFCEFEVITGGPLRGITVEVYNTSGQERCMPGTLDRIDADALAKQIGAQGGQESDALLASGSVVVLRRWGGARFRRGQGDLDGQNRAKGAANG